MTNGIAEAIVFDFDGVLADTERVHLAAFQDVLAARGWRLDEDAYFDRYLGFDDRDLIVEFARDCGIALPIDEISALIESKGRRYAERLGAGGALFPQAAGSVTRLGARYPLAIASGSLRHEIVAILDTAGLSGAFRTIVGADEVARSKPAPDLYAEAIRRLGVSAGRAVAVEDSRWGIESARAAGLRTIAVTSSYPASALTAADAVVTSLEELTEALVEHVVQGLKGAPGVHGVKGF